MDIVITSEGSVRCLYSETIELKQLGTLDIRRASHVEPDERGRWWADLGPVGGPRLGPYPMRSFALGAEERWIRESEVLNDTVGPLKTVPFPCD